MERLLVQIASTVDAPVDQVKLIICLLAAYPLGSWFIRVPDNSPSLKHLFSIAVTLLYFFPILHLEFAFLQLLGSVLATYVITATLKGPRMPWIVFAVVFGHLTMNHAIRTFSGTSIETIEITMPQMVLTMKLTTFAWNVYDGSRPAEDLDKWQLEKRVVKLPSLLEFLGYAFYFPGILVGPYLEYANYKALIDGTVFKSVDADHKKPGFAVPTGRKRVAYRKLAIGLGYLVAYVFLSGSFSYQVTIAPWFAARGLLYRIVYFQFCGFIERAKYYSIWAITEGSSILTGLGFTGYNATGESQWQGAANVDVANIEMASNPKVLFDSWNTKTNIWLRECVYKRVTAKGKKPGFRSSMLTFLTSAFWHGIAPGYYMAFLFGGFMTTVGRLCRKNIRPFILASKSAPLQKAYDVVGSICTVMLINYATAPFMLLSLKDSFNGWRALGWYGIVMIGVPMTLFYAGGVKVLQKRIRTMEGGVPARENKLPTTPGLDEPMLPPAFEKHLLSPPLE